MLRCAIVQRWCDDRFSEEDTPSRYILTQQKVVTYLAYRAKVDKVSKNSWDAILRGMNDLHQMQLMATPRLTAYRVEGKLRADPWVQRMTKSVAATSSKRRREYASFSTLPYSSLLRVGIPLV
jgi:hypothetical protein